MRLAVRGGHALVGDRFIAPPCPIVLDSDDGRIHAVDGMTGSVDASFDASGLLVLPGIVDIHGDAFERQLQPRPGVTFAPAVALRESDRQIVANGITTAFHAVTCSWEPGLRSLETARSLVDAVAALKPGLSADTHIQLRHETYNLAAEPHVVGWLRERRISALAFNDHMSGTVTVRKRPDKLAKMMERTGLDRQSFEALVERVIADAPRIPDSIARLAAVARDAGVPALSHDDASPAARRMYRTLSVAISEFPLNEPAALEAREASEHIVFGAPNVVRGGSHTGCPSATDMIARGLCSVLASDYYYPAPLLAAFKIADEGLLPLDAAWRLISANPAMAMGLDDRGMIATGKRADIVLVAPPSDEAGPRIVATVTAGRIVHLADADRLRRN